VRKADRASRYGGTNRERAHGFGWMNWHIDRGRLDFAQPDREWRKYLRRVSWRRVL